MGRGCWAVLLQELSQVQRQEGLQRGRAEGTDPETLGRAEGQAQALPGRRPFSARPAAHLCIFHSAQQGSPSAGAIGVSPAPDSGSSGSSCCPWGAWPGRLPTIRDPGGPAPRGGVQAQVGQVEKSPHEGPRKGQIGGMVMPSVPVYKFRDGVPTHILLRAKGRAKGRHLL